MSDWRPTEVLAWTEREGPGRGPTGAGRRLWFVLAGAMSVVFFGIMSSDALCPDHRLWVLTLGGASLIAAGTAIVGLIDGWAGAPLLALAAAIGGVGIGLIDAIHSPSRGRLIALGFSVVFAGACWLVWHQRRQHRWDRAVVRSLVTASADVTRIDVADMNMTGIDVTGTEVAAHDSPDSLDAPVSPQR